MHLTPAYLKRQLLLDEHHPRPNVRVRVKVRVRIAKLELELDIKLYCYFRIVKSESAKLPRLRALPIINTRFTRLPNY